MVAAWGAVLLLPADGRVHLRQFHSIASYGKPMFIDKPLALRTDEAKEIFARYRLLKKFDVLSG